MRRALVTGFGPFPGVEDNPTAALARAVDGQRIGEVELVGRVLRVSWAEGPDTAIAFARELEAEWVVGLGVATARHRVEVETIAVCEWRDRPDVDGICDGGLSGPPVVHATLDTAALASALDARLSDDAGRYVCNAWLYRVCHALEVPVGFVHVPSAGLSVERLLRGLAVLC